MREKLSKLHIKGAGIEIGALHNCLHVEPGVRVTFVDRAPLEEINKSHGDVGLKVENWIIDDAERLATFADTSQDFVIANHVFEHCADPVRAMKHWLRVLKPGGVIYAAIPDKTLTFDRNRAVTSLWHMLEDYFFGPQRSAADHYRDWFTHATIEDGQNVDKKVADALLAQANIHFHVFTKQSIERMMILFTALFPISDFSLHVNGAEVIVIARKSIA